jgi:DNA polymerase-3 subunit delta
MRIKFVDLERQLKHELLPIYLITGDEPFQLGQAGDAIRAAARCAAYAERELIEVGPKFEWQQLVVATLSLSLFGDRRIIDLRVPNGQIGNEGGKALKAYCQAPPQDVLLLITMPKLEQKQLASAWAKAIDATGGILQVWPLEYRQLVTWLQQRLRQADIQATPEVVQVLAERVEGNLLSAAQEVEKLVLLHGTGKIGLEQIHGAVADNARFDVFALLDTALGGSPRHALRMLHSLRAEGTPAPVVLWALARELRTLLTVLRAIERGASVDQALSVARVWPKRKSLFFGAVQRQRIDQINRLLTLCQETDAAIKGALQIDPWQRLVELTLGLCGKQLLAG